MRLPSSTAFRTVAAAAAVLVLTAPHQAAAQTEEEGFILRLDLVTEYEDNVALRDDRIVALQDDVIFRIVPSIELHRLYGEHSFTVDGRLEFREGVDTKVSETNANLTAGAELEYSGGLTVRPSYEFGLTNFDQALFVTDPSITEPDVARTLHNAAGVNASYVPRERLAFEGGYKFTRDDFEFGTAGGDDKREIHEGRARVAVPVTRDFVAYARGTIRDQDADERTEFIFQRMRYVGGLRAEGNRLAVYGEAGVGEVDFQQTAGTEFDEVVFRLGVEVLLDDDSTLTAWAGRDEYGELEAAGQLSATLSDGSRLNLQVRRATENSFSRVLRSLFYESTLVGGEWRKEFLDRWLFNARGSYFRLDSGTQEDDTVIASARLEYELNPWLRLGGAYRYATRSSSLAGNDFDDNRVSAFLSFVRER